MNTEAVTNKDSILNSHLSKILQFIMKISLDPLLLVRKCLVNDR